jgi:hypothetical protein
MYAYIILVIIDFRRRFDYRYSPLKAVWDRIGHDDWEEGEG